MWVKFKSSNFEIITEMSEKRNYQNHRRESLDSLGYGSGNSDFLFRLINEKKIFWNTLQNLKVGQTNK